MVLQLTCNASHPSRDQLSIDRDTQLEAYLPDDIDNPPEAYFEAMRRLRLEPPDEETVERIVAIARRIWREQEELAEQEGVGVEPPLRGPAGASNKVQDISRALSPCGNQSFPHALGSATSELTGKG